MIQLSKLGSLDSLNLNAIDVIFIGNIIASFQTFQAELFLHLSASRTCTEEEQEVEVCS